MDLGGGVRMLVSTLHRVAYLCQARCVMGAGKSELCSGTPKMHVLIAHADSLSMPQFPQLTCQISVGTAVSLAVVLILAMVPPGALSGAGSCGRWRKPQFYHQAALLRNIDLEQITSPLGASAVSAVK